MACTKQSAVDFIKNAWPLLVEYLKNQTLIAEKLKELRVFNFENVREITSEKNPSQQTRNILEFVTKKGEEASYAFLRILDSEKNRTLQKNVEPDLHQWISCFSFREEPNMKPTGSRPCQQYQIQLRTKAQAILRSHSKHIQSLLGGSDVESFYYAKLVLDRDEQRCPVSTKIKLKSKKYKKCRTKKLSTYIPQNKLQLSPEDLLKENEQDILLVGKPGIGKTAITLEMINLWTNMENRRLNYLFYFNEATLPDMSRPINLESLLFDAYVEPAGLNKEEALEVLQDIKTNSENVIIIFDGIRDVPPNSVLQKILNKELLPYAKVVLSCRPDREDILSDWEAWRVYVLGFSEDSIHTYLSHVLKSKPDVVSYIIGNPELRSLCHVPVHALLIAGSVLFQSTSEGPYLHTVTFSLEAPTQCTATEIYLDIFRHLMNRCQKTSSFSGLDNFISCNKENILHLAKCAFVSLQNRSILIDGLEETNIHLNFLSKFTIRHRFSLTKTYSIFLHNTMQEFFVALWLLANPGDIDDFFQKCQNENGKHMRHVIPFLSGLLSQNNVALLKCLFSEEHIQLMSGEFHEKLLSAFLHTQEDHDLDDEVIPEDASEDFVFLCQCLLELQSPQACSVFLKKINYCFELMDGCLDPYQSWAVSYVIKQSNVMKIVLELKDCKISDHVLKLILHCYQHFRVDSCFLRQIWTAALSCENSRVSTDLLDRLGSKMYLPVWEPSVFKRAGEVIRQSQQKMNLFLYLGQTTQPLSEDIYRLILSVLPCITSLCVIPSKDVAGCPEDWQKTARMFQLDLCLHTLLLERDSSSTKIIALMSLFPINDESDFLSELYCHVRDSNTGKMVLPHLQKLYMLAPAVWSIDLSKTKASLLLEVLKLQPSKPVDLGGWSDEETDVQSLLRCLPFISQLRFIQLPSQRPEDWQKRLRSIHLNLCVHAALCDEEFPVVRTLLNLLDITDVSNFMFDLYAHVKEIETESQRKALTGLQTVYQSVPERWCIDLSKKKASFFLELLKFQKEKKPVELTDWSVEESEVKQFLQCMPYISQLRFTPPRLDCSSIEWQQKRQLFLLDLCLQAALYERESVLTTVRTLLRVSRVDDELDFLLDLYSYARAYDSQTDKSVISALMPLYQSVPESFWFIDLSERKTSISLEVLKLQIQKKSVVLTGLTDEESEVRSFLQFLPYISQLRFEWNYNKSSKIIQFLVNLSVAAADYDLASGSSFSKRLSSVLCLFEDEDYEDFYEDCNFLLDLCSCVLATEADTAKELLSSFQSVYQSGPPFWHIDLSKRKSSILLEALKLQAQKKPVQLKGWSHEESEVRSFLQCLPYISQLRFDPDSIYDTSISAIQFLVNLSAAAANHDSVSGRSFSEHLSFVCSYSSFPFEAEYHDDFIQTDFLLNLYCHLLACESETAKKLLPSFQSVYQSGPPFWHIDLSKRKSSILLEALKLQAQKKPVQLKGWSHEESEVRSFLQCLPYISQLRFYLDPIYDTSISAIQFLVNLNTAAANHDSVSGGSFSEHLSSVCSYSSFPFEAECHDYFMQTDFLLNLYSHLLACESETAKKLLPSFQSVYQSAPSIWSIDLSKQKASLLLEVLKLQSQKKPVKLISWSNEESEVRSFLQCLPYISQLRFHSYSSQTSNFLGNLCAAAAECDTATGENFSELLSTVCSYSTFPFGHEDNSKQSDALLELYSHMKHYESQTGRSLFPVFKPVYQSAPGVWSVDLSRRKSSTFLEVLKLQNQKKPLQLRGWSDEKSEVMSYLQCLPYISQLRFHSYSSQTSHFLGNLCAAAAECDTATGENFAELLSTVCSYSTFPFGHEDNSKQSDVLLELYSHMKHYESQTGRSLFPVFKPVYQSAPGVWSVDLSRRKSSTFLEVLKLQNQKKPLQLRGWSDEKSEVMRFLQCLPYISQLRFYPYLSQTSNFLGNLCAAAAECDTATGENFSELLSTVCSYSTFPFGREHNSKQSDALLELYSHMKHYESQTGRSLFPVFKPVYQSAPGVWSVDLSRRKSSTFLEVLKLQNQKKPLELRGWSDEKSEVMSFLQCLPYISQLRFHPYSSQTSNFLGNLCAAAAECDTATGENFSELLSTVCGYSTFPFGFEDNSKQSDVLLELYSHMKHCESQTGRSLFPVFKPVYQSAPGVWSVDLSRRKSSTFLEVLKLQNLKKPLELRGWSDEKSEVMSFLQCLPYISQLRFHPYSSQTSNFLGNLCAAAAECDTATGENFSELLSTVCGYSTFPFGFEDNSKQSDVLLELYSHMKHCESQTGRSLFPVFKPVYQSAPGVWSVDLSRRKSSTFLEVLKLQNLKKPLELRGWSDEKSEVMSFLQCLPYISQLRFNDCHDVKSLLLNCGSFGSQQELFQLLQTLDFNFNLKLQRVLQSSKCRPLGRVLGWIASKLNLTLTLKHISLKGLRLLFRRVSYIHKLSLNGEMVMRLARAMQTGKGLAAVTVEELNLDLNSTAISQRVLSRVLSCLALLLRLWTVQCLDLTSCKVEGHSLIILCCQQGPLKLRLSKENMQQLSLLVSEVQDDDLTQSFLDKVGGDLTTCTLTQEALLYLLQCYSKPITVDFRKSQTTEWSIRNLLPLLNRIRFKRPTPGFIMDVIREIYPTRSPLYVRSLLSSTKNYINLTTRGLATADCDALRFILQHSQTVRLNLMWTSIPEGELESLLEHVGNVSQLSVDRQLLWRFLQCCKSSDVQQGAAVALLQALQHRLDFSCLTAIDLTEECTQEAPLPLSPEDCRVISTMIQRVNTKTELNVMECTVDEAGLEHIYSILKRVRLRCSKAQLLQLLTLVRVGSEREHVRRAESLSYSVGGEVDLSHTLLDSRACESLALFLDYSEGLSELDLSYCQLTDNCLEPLLPYLHKIQVLDLSNNSITDQGAELIYNKVKETNSIETVRLFNNRIKSTRLYQGDKRFELWG